MAWKDINPFLSRFKHLEPPDKAVKDVCVRIVKQTLDIHLKHEEIRVEKYSIRLFTSPVVKNEIFLHRSQILLDINKTLAGKHIQDIV
ncbi:hypothetical protein CL654_00910 [bacterium]|nr:hypothetical protein [bacterium]|tara:strand:+ start:5321 stop:5584 length:264 start_codon:yes stop_codon:yes gene_type:complete